MKKFIKSLQRFLGCTLDADLVDKMFEDVRTSTHNLRFNVNAISFKSKARYKVPHNCCVKYNMLKNTFRVITGDNINNVDFDDIKLQCKSSEIEFIEYK